jgi:hypothetical protein
MVVEYELLPYLEWLLIGPRGLGAIPLFLFLITIVGMASVLLCYGLTSLRQGPVEAFYVVAQVIANAVPDFMRTSLRRTWAIASLAIKESIRRKVIVGFVVFAVLLLYAGWFLDVSSSSPAKLYLSFVMTATTYLILMLALLLSTLSLPADIKNRTIYTIVTKPVRSAEIVLGRIVGFTVVGTVLLALMGVISYGFVVRNLSHRHDLDADPAEITAALARLGDGVGDVAWEGETTLNRGHRHQLRIDPNELAAGARLTTDTEQGHWHEIIQEGEGENATYQVGPPQGHLLARVPVYGKLRFLTRTGSPGRGINVGNEWSYREYIDGGTLAAAIWTFEGVTEDRFPDGLPVEMNIRIFRTHKGDIERGVMGSIEVKNPNQSARINSSVMDTFEFKEFEILGRKIPRKLQAIDSVTNEIREVDLFEDLAPEGKLEVWVKCAESGQYFGMAQADLYLRALDRPFAWNFAKGYGAIWLQMVLVICFGVMFSTFLNGPIAILATIGVVTLGLRTRFVMEVLGGVIEGNELLNQFLGTPVDPTEIAYGGGPIESFIRLVTQMNVMSDLDMHWLAAGTIKFFDLILMSLMWAASQMLPDFSYFDTSEYVAYGFNIEANLLLQQATSALAFIAVLTIVGYFFLRTREIAA